MSVDPRDRVFIEAPQVGAIGSPSTNDSLVVHVVDSARHDPLMGQMLFVETPSTRGGQETTQIGLGVVKQVRQTNATHADPRMATVIGRVGRLDLSGDKSDTRTADITMQAAYLRYPDEDQWRQAGNGLATAPPTGVPLRYVTNDVLDTLIAASTDDVHYLGHLHASVNRGEPVRAPFSMPDFTEAEGAYHLAVVGQSGSGKTAFSGYVVASQMRHKEMGFIVIDPQGQWASESGQPWSLQGFAAELGRPVLVRRISEDLQLMKDAPLFTTLLSKTKFVGEIGKMGSEVKELFLDEVVRVIRDIDDWETANSDDLLRVVLTTLNTCTDPSDPDNSANYPYLRRIYSSGDRVLRLRDLINDALTNPRIFADVARPWRVIHNLFSDTNPVGNPRQPLMDALRMVTGRPENDPAPMLILDMSTSGITWLDTVLADDEQAQIIEALATLDDDQIKAAILRQIGTALKTTSETAFRSGGTLNTAVIMDEAWRFVPPLERAPNDEVKELSREWAGYSRDMRKFGISLFFITQSPRSINADIWDQVMVKFIGYGLSGADLDKVADELDSRDDIRLYKAFAPPKATNPRVYPWLALGPVSPLSFTKAPIALAAYTDFEQFRDDNRRWIAPLRAELGMPVAHGNPAKPTEGALQQAAERLNKARAGAAATAGKTRAANKQAADIRANKDTGGVDPSITAGSGVDAGFGDPLAGLGGSDETPPPF